MNKPVTSTSIIARTRDSVARALRVYGDGGRIELHVPAVKRVEGHRQPSSASREPRSEDTVRIYHGTFAWQGVFRNVVSPTLL